MSQSMNGLSILSGNGINESDNISCNNIACNNVTSNIVSTDNLTAIQTNGAIANYSGLVSANKFSAPNIHADVKIDADQMDCRNLSSYNLISGLQITGTRINCNEKFVSTAIECTDLSANNIKNIRVNCGAVENNLLLGENTGVLITANNSNYNVGLGTDVFNSLVSNSSYNIALGYGSGKDIKGNHNICLGYGTGQLLNATQDIYNDSVCIGNSSKITSSNQIVLGTSQEIVLVRGDIVCDNDIRCAILKSNRIDCSGIDCDTLSINNIELTSTTINSLTGLTDNVQERFDKLSQNSGLAITTGLGNVSLGRFSLGTCTTGSYNVAIGEDAMIANNGNSNIAIGKFSGYGLNQLAYDCICLGVESGQDGTLSTTLLSNSVAIGAYSKFNASNQIALGTIYHTVKIDGKLEGPDIISKSKIKYGQKLATSNNLTTVFFPSAFPVGSLPIVQLTQVYSGNLTTLGVLYVYDYSNTYLTYGYLLNGVHSETSITVNWMAMIP